VPLVFGCLACVSYFNRRRNASRLVAALLVLCLAVVPFRFLRPPLTPVFGIENLMYPGRTFDQGLGVTTVIAVIVLILRAIRRRRRDASTMLPGS
jgi:hypothetical protein